MSKYKSPIGGSGKRTTNLFYKSGFNSLINRVEKLERNACLDCASTVAVYDAATVIPAQIARDGGTILWNAANVQLTLPKAEKGMRLNIIIGVETTDGANIITHSTSESFFGTIPLNSDVADADDALGVGVPQQITYATSIAAPASYDAMKFVASTATIGGVAGEVIRLTAVSDVAWNVDIPNHQTSANDAATLVLIQAR
jgi:hypothetical protein